MNTQEMPELLRAAEVRALLRIRGNGQWIKFRRSNPQIQIAVPGLTEVRYSKAAVLRMMRKP